VTSGAATTQVGIVEWAERIESARALELRVAAVLGAWVPRVAPTGAKLLLARHARHFGWHGELWDGLVPVLHDRPEGSSVVDGSLLGVEAALGTATEPKAVYDDVLPIVVAAYRRWSEEATPIAERPVMRVLDLVLNDLDFDAQEGHDLFNRA
jgi:hypothetical protein